MRGVTHTTVEEVTVAERDHYLAQVIPHTLRVMSFHRENRAIMYNLLWESVRGYHNACIYIRVAGRVVHE